VMCLLGVCYIAANLRRQIHQKTWIFWVKMGVFKPNVKKIQTFIILKLLYLLQPNFAQ